MEKQVRNLENNKVEMAGKNDIETENVFISNNDILDTKEYKEGLKQFENIKSEIYLKNIPVTVYARFHIAYWTTANIILNYQVVNHFQNLKMSDVNKLQVIFRKYKYRAYVLTSKNDKVVIQFVKTYDLL